VRNTGDWMRVQGGQIGAERGKRERKGEEENCRGTQDKEDRVRRELRLIKGESVIIIYKSY
jgi:hypothetical protein